MTNMWADTAATWNSQGALAGFHQAITSQFRSLSDAFARKSKMRRARKVFVSLDGSDDFRQMAFTFAVIALSAKLARVDGEPKAEEFVAFLNEFPIPDGEQEKVKSLFDLAAKDDADALHHARQIAGLFPASQYREFLREVLCREVRIAMIDGPLTEGELALLSRISQELSISRWQYARILREVEDSMRPGDPYFVLGVDPKWGDSEIKRAYHQLIRLNHPDAVMAAGGKGEVLVAASQRMATINAAYSAIRFERGSAAA